MAVFLKSFFWVNERSILQSALPQSFTPQTGPEGLLFHDSLLNPFPIDEAAILRLPAGVALEHQAQRRSLNSTERTVGLNAYFLMNEGQKAMMLSYFELNLSSVICLAIS